MRRDREDNSAALIRKILIEILIFTAEKGESLKSARDRTGFSRLSDPDRAYLTRLIALAFRHVQVIDRVLARFIHRKPQNKYLPLLTAILRGACAEILFAETPVHAVTQIYLQRVKTDLKIKHTAGFVGGVLSAIIKHKAELTEKINPVDLLPPEFLVTLTTDYSSVEITEIAEFLAQEAEIDFSPVKAGVAELAKKIDGIVIDEFSFRFLKNGSPQKAGGFTEGDFTVQSYASARVIAGAGEISGKTLLDLCAAPGGKTVNAVCAGAKVTACDISVGRGERLKETLTRTAAIEKTKIFIGDTPDFSEPFDIVLLDAPCSATGTFRKNPDLFLNYKHKNIAELIDLQKKLLQKAAVATRKGGMLIYAVCSLLKAEGDMQVIDFMKINPEFSLIAPPRLSAFPAGAVISDGSALAGAVRLLPGCLHEIGGIDGFFIAYLQKAH